MNGFKFMCMSVVLLMSMKNMGREPVYEVYNETPYVAEVSCTANLGGNDLKRAVPPAEILETTSKDHVLLRPSFSQFKKSMILIINHVDVTTGIATPSVDPNTGLPSVMSDPKGPKWTSHKVWCDGLHDLIITIKMNGEIKIETPSVLGRELKALKEKLPSVVKKMRFV